MASISTPEEATPPAASKLANSCKRPPGHKLLLRWITQGTPTRYNMLLIRTANRELGEPNTNGDHLAPLFRDALMPVRGWWLRNIPGSWTFMRLWMEHPRHGVPGAEPSASHSSC